MVKQFFWKVSGFFIRKVTYCKYVLRPDGTMEITIFTEYGVNYEI